MNEMPSVSVAVVTWNAERFIKDCLDSVFAQNIPGLEIIVADNGSSDATIDILKTYAGRILLICNDRNQGFCAANNQALLKAAGRYVLTLNSDIILDKDYIAGLVRCLEENPRVGMVQGKILRMDKKTIDCLGLRIGWGTRFHNIAEGKPDSGAYAPEREIFGPCAAAALYRRELLNDIRWGDEFFDNRFFFLAEDFDLAWRARHKGWTALYTSRTQCYHYRDSSAHKSSFRQYLSFRNRYFLIIKNARFKPRLAPEVVSSVLFYDIPRFILLFFTNPYTIKAVREILAHFPELWAKRKKGLLCKR